MCEELQIRSEKHGPYGDRSADFMFRNQARFASSILSYISVDLERYDKKKWKVYFVMRTDACSCFWILGVREVDAPMNLHIYQLKDKSEGPER